MRNSTRIRTLVTILVFTALAGMALAQSPATTFRGVLDRLYATEVPCTATVLTAEIASQYDYAVCGYMNDQLLDINQRWTAEYLEARGWFVTEWERQIGSRTYIAGIADWSNTGAVSLMMANSTDGTAIILVADRD